MTESKTTFGRRVENARPDEEIAMPATAKTKAQTKGHYTADEAAELLRLDVETLVGDYAGLLTDARPPEKRVRGSRRLFLRGEVDLVLSDGWEALTDFRTRMGRRRPAA